MTQSNWCPVDPVKPASQNRGQLAADCPPATSLEHLGFRPLLITGLFRDLLIKHFASPDNIEDPDIRNAVWREGKDTGILIESVFRWRGDLVEKRPAVVIKRNAYQNAKITINDLAGTDEQGFEHFVTLWVGSHTLFCIHGTGASCEILATEVQRDLTQFGPAIRGALGLFKFQVVEVGPVSELEEATQNYVVPITVGWAYQETWTLRQEALPLTKVHLDLDSNTPCI